jgi:hypothetical protein
MRKYMALLMLGAVCSVGAGVPVVPGIPEPSVSPVSWELKFRYQDPQKVSVVVPGQDKPVLYWYVPYSVENPGPQEVPFYPKFELVTDTLQVIPSEVRVSPEAFRAIQRRTGDALLLTPERAVGKLLVGQDRQRHGVAIWKNVDPATRSFTVYVTGLSGETVRLKNPEFDDKKPEGDKNQKYFILRKTLAVPYKLPGGESTRELAVPEREEGNQKWIMR